MSKVTDFFSLLWFSVNLLDTSTAQGELGWLPDPPEIGVSIYFQGWGAAENVTKWKNIIQTENVSYPLGSGICNSFLS